MPPKKSSNSSTSTSTSTSTPTSNTKEKQTITFLVVEKNGDIKETEMQIKRINMNFRRH